MAYDRHHCGLIIALALDFLKFFPEIAKLSSNAERRERFLPIAEIYFLHIRLRRVGASVRGRHHKLSFFTAQLCEIDRLPDAVNIRTRLTAQGRPFPAVALGYTIMESGAEPAAETVTSVTHGFVWPPPMAKGIGLQKAGRLLLLGEWVLLKEAEARQGL